MADDILKIKLDGIEVIGYSEFLKELDLEKLIAQEAQISLTRIKQETTAGRTADGGSLRPYSEGYKRMRAAAGLSTTTNLTVTQELLKSMVIEPIKTGQTLGARIAFEGSHTASKPLAAKTNTEKNQKGGGQQVAKRAKGSSLRSAAISPQGSGGRARQSGGGEEMPNASLAEDLYARGFVGWFTFGKQDLARIQKTLNAAISRVSKRIFTTK